MEQRVERDLNSLLLFLLTALLSKHSFSCAHTRTSSHVTSVKVGDGIGPSYAIQIYDIKATEAHESMFFRTHVRKHTQSSVLLGYTIN